MTGLDLETFLLLLRADLTAWTALGLVTLVLALLVWSCWRSRRVLRNCLVLSLAGHLGLVLYGSTIPAVMWTVGLERREPSGRTHLRQIRVAPLAEAGSSSREPRAGDPGPRGSTSGRWDLKTAPLALAAGAIKVARPKIDEQRGPVGAPEITLAPLTAMASVTPEVRAKESASGKSLLEPRPEPPVNEDAPAGPNHPMPPILAEVDGRESAIPDTNAEAARAERKSAAPAALGLVGALAADRRLRPDRAQPIERTMSPPQIIVAGKAERRDPPAANGATSPLATDEKSEKSGAPRSVETLVAAVDPIPLARATPDAPLGRGAGTRLAALGDRAPGQGLIDIPKIYQPRLEPDRSTRAQRIGASAASELAVERALDWLARHQDDDGGWDGGIARYEDGTAVKGDDDFTVHCPVGEKCSGECAYWEADTALTGLALLTFLGAGYTQTDNRYSEVVGKGLDFLIARQAPDGDLRGASQVVGMYCHAMATLAMCEAYALTGDARLRGAAERAVAFLVRARAKDGMAWRYAPGAPTGDTSILGWVVMGLKSAKEVGIPIPGEPAVRRGTLLWLDKIASGEARGLARYQPGEPVTATMTAEAWVCRQFLGVGGPGQSSSEAAEFLLKNDSDRGQTNVYYWYYATLALYQHGGQPWTKWNGGIRDKIVALQSTSGHQTGSWGPDSSVYGSKGGRIYCTTLAAMSLEVYYRYLRLYDEPKIPLEAGATPVRRPE